MTKWIRDSSLKVYEEKTELCLFHGYDHHPISISHEKTFQLNWMCAFCGYLTLKILCLSGFSSASLKPKRSNSTGSRNRMQTCLVIYPPPQTTYSNLEDGLNQILFFSRSTSIRSENGSSDHFSDQNMTKTDNLIRFYPNVSNLLTSPNISRHSDQFPTRERSTQPTQKNTK